VESLGECAFAGCSKLRELLLSPVLKEIGARCFERVRIGRVDLSRTRVGSLGECVFGCCSELHEAVLPGTLATAHITACADVRLSMLILPVASGGGLAVPGLEPFVPSSSRVWPGLGESWRRDRFRPRNETFAVYDHWLG
jgi:hypothetical protein